MPPIHLLIKPASGLCNMRCTYCFYADVSSQRETNSFGIMSADTMDKMIKNTFSYATNQVTFAFQGGEPTLAGLDYFKSFIKMVKLYNIKNIPVDYALQTNGYLLDWKWAVFFKRNHFLIGLSLDGIEECHNAYRLDETGMGTYERVMESAKLLKEYEVEFNILTVLHKKTAQYMEEIYAFYKKNNFYYQQYIPCLDPLREVHGENEYSLTAQCYGAFLKKSFDLWYKDWELGRPIYIRYFENLVRILLDIPPESCGMLGRCGLQFVVEANGNVYPCDFYVIDKYCMGNLMVNTFEELYASEVVKDFIEPSLSMDSQCNDCKWQKLCRGGCRRDRQQVDGSLGLNYYCSAYKEFFEYSYSRFHNMVSVIKNTP